MIKKKYLRRLRKAPAETYTKFQVAMLYFPDQSYDAASRRLRKWIAEDPALLKALKAAGYTPAQRHFTEEQYGILREFIGDPL